jgi:hypothetical protein
MRSLFHRLAGSGAEERLAWLQVPGGLIEPQTLGGFFFNQQKAAIALDDSGNSDAWFPTVSHDEKVRRRKFVYFNVHMPLPAMLWSLR